VNGESKKKIIVRILLISAPWMVKPTLRSEPKRKQRGYRKESTDKRDSHPKRFGCDCQNLPNTPPFVNRLLQHVRRAVDFINGKKDLHKCSNDHRAPCRSPLISAGPCKKTTRVLTPYRSNPSRRSAERTSTRPTSQISEIFQMPSNDLLLIRRVVLALRLRSGNLAGADPAGLSQDGPACHVGRNRDSEEIQNSRSHII